MWSRYKYSLFVAILSLCTIWFESILNLISDFPIQWHLSDQKVICSSFHISKVSKMCLHPKLRDGCRRSQSWDVKSSEPLLAVPKFGTLGQKWPFCHFVNGQNSHFCPNVSNFGTVGDGPENLTFQLRDRRRRSQKFDALTSEPSTAVPKFGT